MIHRPEWDDSARSGQPEQRVMPTDAKKSTSIRRETVVDSWNSVVMNGAGRDKWALDTIDQAIKDANIPEFKCELMDVSTGGLGGLMGKKRDFLVVTHRRLRDYRMYICARDFGAHLDVSWFLTIEPGFLKRTVSKYTTGNPQAISQAIDLFDQQDLSAYVSVAHHCVTQTVEMLMQELNQNTSRLNTKSKGFLEVW